MGDYSVELEELLREYSELILAKKESESQNKQTVSESPASIKRTVSEPIQRIVGFIEMHSGERIAIFLHSSLVLERKENIEVLFAKRSEKVKFYLPENSYYELRILEKYSSKDNFRRRAKRLLELIGNSLVVSHKDLCVQAGYAAKAYGYDVGLFVFYEPAAAAEFSRRVADSNSNCFLLSYNPFNVSNIPCYCADISITPNRMCRALNNERYENKPDFQTITINNGKTDVKEITFSSLKRLDKGGSEGQIYISPELPGKCIKIYKESKPSERMTDKLRMLMRRYGDLDGFAFPSDLVYCNGSCIGFVMDRFKAKLLSQALYNSPAYQSDEARRTLIRNISVALLEARLIQLVVADLSPKNIMVDNNGRVIFIDVDSMEFCHYPGGGITPPYGHPNITSEVVNTRLRTFEESNFSFAVMLFFILLGWENPLTQGGCTDELKWLKNKFPFTKPDDPPKFRLFRRHKEPEVVLKGVDFPNAEKINAWKSQPKAVQEGFVEVFNFETTYDIGEWLKRLFADEL